MTETLLLSPDAVRLAATLIRQGELVAVPTETVYGLAADATCANAVAKIYEAKGRPSFNPLIVHVKDLDMAIQFADLSQPALRLADRFWPGPLTLVLPARAGSPIAAIVTAGLPTIAIRMPTHPAIRALIDAAGCPLAAPSANASGRISPTRPEHVAATLAGRIAMILDGGPTTHGLESTIVAVDGDRLRLLRPGPVTASALEACADLPLSVTQTDAIEAPGQLASHYAPSKPLRLDATWREAGEWWIGFGGYQGDDTLSATGDLIEAAARLFETLHRGDASDAWGIAVAPVPDDGIGAAINDRLRRAAAPR